MKFYFRLKYRKKDSNLMVVFADMGVTNAMCLPGMEQYMKTTNKYTKKNKADLIWHVGDLAYDMFEIGGNKVRFRNLLNAMRTVLFWSQFYIF